MRLDNAYGGKALHYHCMCDVNIHNSVGEQSEAKQPSLCTKNTSLLPIQDPPHSLYSSVQTSPRPQYERHLLQEDIQDLQKALWLCVVLTQLECQLLMMLHTTL